MAALADLPDLAVRISQALTAAGVPHAVSGSLAMAAHGFVRATRDIVLLVIVPALRLPDSDPRHGDLDRLAGNPPGQ